MAYEDAANYNTLRSMKGLPIGAILPWAGAQDTIPVGWLECSGNNVPITRYPLLYNVIGNVYGGVAGSTFKIPPLTSGNFGIMDIFQGHFNWLQSAGNAHKPENANLADDEFWQSVGQADDGNQGSVTTQSHFTTIDVFGEQTSKPDLVAKYGDFELTTGTADTVINVLERKTTDIHLPNHNHSYTTDGDSSYNRKNGGATLNSSYWGEDFYCYLSGTAANVSRSTNDPPKDGTQMSTVGYGKTSGGVTGVPRSGGGNIINGGPSGPQYAATEFSDGNGFSGGDMWAHQGGTKYFFTSIAPEEKNISGLTGHRHGTIDSTFESKIKILNPGIVSDVKMNNVTIDNSPGNQFGTINMSSATPTLGMLFIIRAY